jgi:hypothetical protein
MSPVLPPLLGLTITALLSGASPGPARNDQETEKRLAQQLMTAAQSYADLRDLAFKHGQRAEIALLLLNKEQQRAELDATIRDRRTLIANFPGNRRWWNNEQDTFYQQTLGLEMDRTQMDREINSLRFEERGLFEEALQEAQQSGKQVRPFNREQLLTLLQKSYRESERSATELKKAIDDAAKQQHTAPRKLLEKARCLAVGDQSSPPPDVVESFLREFTDRAGGKAWLNGAAGKTMPGKKDRGGSRTKRFTPKQNASGS